MAPSLQIIVVGAGEVGQHLARILSKEGHGVTVVDSDPLKIRLLNESLDVQGLVGDGARGVGCSVCVSAAQSCVAARVTGLSLGVLRSYGGLGECSL